MQKIQDFNSDPTSYIHTTHIINDLFFKTDGVSVVSCLQYITSVLAAAILHNNLFHHATVYLPGTHLPTSLKYFCLGIISHSLPTSWTFYMKLSHSTNFGECISAHWHPFHIHQKYDRTGLSPHQPAHLHPTPDISMYYFQCLNVYLTHHPHSKVLLLHEISPDSAGCKDHNPCITCILAVLDPSLATKLNQISTSDMILDPMFTAK